MICPRCHGSGWVFWHPPDVPFSQTFADLYPCDYEGCVNGHVHCCDGLTEQPEPPGETNDP